MEGSNYWGYSYNTQHSYPRLWLNHLKKAEVKFGQNVAKKKQHKNYQDEDKKSTINKKLILRFRYQSLQSLKYLDIFKTFILFSIQTTKLMKKFNVFIYLPNPSATVKMWHKE